MLDFQYIKGFKTRKTGNRPAPYFRSFTTPLR